MVYFTGITNWSPILLKLLLPVLLPGWRYIQVDSEETETGDNANFNTEINNVLNVFIQCSKRHVVSRPQPVSQKTRLN